MGTSSTQFLGLDSRKPHWARNSECDLVGSWATSRPEEGRFLECNGDLGTFDRIVMNPPFANADDIKHTMHALKMLKPGGRLVAICANGPRQNDKLRPIVEACGGIWEELPSDIFISAGTSVRTVLLMLDRKPGAALFRVNRRNAIPEAGARGQTPSVFPLDLFFPQNHSNEKDLLSAEVANSSRTS
jgi:hypothetical protein